MSASRQLPLALDRLPPPDFDNYFAGPNAAEVEALRSAAAENDPAWIALVGPPGSGKSHLLSAAVAHAKQLGQRPLFVTGGSLRAGGAPDALRTFADCDLLCLDDLDPLFGDGPWEESLFHLLNDLRTAGRRLVFSLSAGLAAQPVRLLDLRSRLAAATRLKLIALSDSEKRELLTTRARGCGISLEGAAVDTLLKRLPRDVPTLVSWLDRLAAASLAQRRRITPRFVNEQIRLASGDQPVASNGPPKDSVV